MTLTHYTKLLDGLDNSSSAIPISTDTIDAAAFSIARDFCSGRIDRAEAAAIMGALIPLTHMAQAYTLSKHPDLGGATREIIASRIYHKLEWKLRESDRVDLGRFRTASLCGWSRSLLPYMISDVFRQMARRKEMTEMLDEHSLAHSPTSDDEENPDVIFDVAADCVLTEKGAIRSKFSRGSAIRMLAACYRPQWPLITEPLTIAEREEVTSLVMEEPNQIHISLLEPRQCASVALAAMWDEFDMPSRKILADRPLEAEALVLGSLARHPHPGSSLLKNFRTAVTAQTPGLRTRKAMAKVVESWTAVMVEPYAPSSKMADAKKVQREGEWAKKAQLWENLARHSHVPEVLCSFAETPQDLHVFFTEQWSAQVDSQTP